MTLRAIIWDVGGVLVRTEDPTQREALAERLNISRSELEDLTFGGESGNRAQRGEISIEEHWANIGKTLGYSTDEVTAFQDQFFIGDELDLSLVDYIRSLREDYLTGLLSNAFSNLRQIVTDVWQIDDAFDVMIISAEVGMMKPDGGIYRLTLEQLNIAPDEAVFIDDFQHNIEGAEAVGLHGIHFKNPAQMRSELNTLLGAG